ncbi:cell wall anchor protein [Actinomadura logoneensis]|uniref:Cell wall anchor protein n=1 Tax=Actinomadura logoneensis TaxID=2293572 RepID=A0A372JIR2_9ACTN|nr:Ig-like domain repeat protein [Actinomadura logoneensis]RFU39809.1 cell wall anchor protein [Actinomadura logoneensis]
MDRLVAVVVAAATVLALAGVRAGTAAAAPGRQPGDQPSQVLTWGRNQFGQLGNDSTEHSNVPVTALLPAGTSVKQVSGGYGFSVALTSDGRVWAWGENPNGQLGDGTTNGSRVPVPVALPAGTTVTALATGDDHTLALTSTGRLLAWGYNDFGQVGDGSTTDRLAPVAVDLPNGTTITAIGAGAGHSLAVTSTGHVLAWGYNNTGQLGTGNYADSSVPVRVPLPEDVTFTAVAGGSAHSLALSSTGQMWSWGWNTYGQLGNNSTTSTNVPVRVLLPEGARVTSLGDGSGHGWFSLALESDGQMLAWGDNSYGQLGNGTTTRSTVPIRVQLPPGTIVSAIAGGDDHTVALTSEGRVLTWGYNRYGQLGDGGNTNAVLPVEAAVPQGVRVQAIGAGQYHTLAVVPVEAAGTTTTLTTSTEEQTHGEPVTLTARVECEDGTPTGTVVFEADGVRLGTAELQDGTATLTVSDLDVGEHVITAHYEGDRLCGPSTSDPVTVVIRRAETSASLHLVKRFDRFVGSAGPHAKARPKAKPRHDARMSAWHDHDAIRYRFVVTNDGDVPINAITVHDSLTGTVSCSSGTLAPGRSVTCYGTHKVTLKEKSRGYVDNSATASGTRADDGRTVVSNEARLRVDITYK